MKQRTYIGPSSVYTEEFKRSVLRRIESGEFYSVYHAAIVLNINRNTIYGWIKKKGINSNFKSKEPIKTSDQQDMNKEKKPVKFVEDVPKSFKNDEAKLEYFILRSAYLEELFKLTNLDEDVKKKALQQLDQRVKESLARGEKSPY